MVKKEILSQAKPKLDMNHVALPACLAANWVTGSFYVELPDLVTRGKDLGLSNHSGILSTGS